MSRPTRKCRLLLSMGFILVALCTGCGSSSVNSATTATGNKSTCKDFFAYESFIQSVKTQPSRSTVRNELQRLEQRLEVDGPTARNRPLEATAIRTVKAIKTDNGDLGNQLNASTSDCMLLHFLPPGSSGSGQGCPSTPNTARQGVPRSHERLNTECRGGIARFVPVALASRYQPRYCPYATSVGVESEGISKYNSASVQALELRLGIASADVCTSWPPLDSGHE